MERPPTPTILRDQIPAIGQIANPDPKGHSQIYNSSEVNQFLAKTPSGWYVPVLVVNPWDAVHTNKINNVYNCVAFAMNTFDPIRRCGYLIDLEEGLWAVLNDPGIAITIMDPKDRILHETPQPGDVLVFWEPERPSNSDWSAKHGGLPVRKACHAARIISSTDVAGAPLTPATIVASKNGNNAPGQFTIAEMIRSASDYDNKEWGVYRLLAPTILPASQDQVDILHGVAKIRDW